MAFKLPKLSYSYSALEPYIDEKTMMIHHSKHHQAYVDNLNKAIEDLPDFENKKIEDLLSDTAKLPTKIRQAVINHGGGHTNHTLYWSVMSPGAKKTPEGVLLEAINGTFGDIDKFKEEFTNKAMGVFGSGWAFLIATKNNKLSLKRHSFQNSPYMHGNIPLMGIDVWEHAYYLKYQNKRLDYISAWWNVLDWNKVEENFQSLKS